MKKSGCTIGMMCLFLISMLSVLCACSRTIEAKGQDESKAKEVTMNHAHQMKTEPPAIPPIDAEAPNRFETASFGLG